MHLLQCRNGTLFYVTSVVSVIVAVEGVGNTRYCWNDFPNSDGNRSKYTTKVLDGMSSRNLLNMASIRIEASEPKGYIKHTQTVKQRSIIL